MGPTKIEKHMSIWVDAYIGGSIPHSKCYCDAIGIGVGSTDLNPIPKYIYFPFFLGLGPDFAFALAAGAFGVIFLEGGDSMSSSSQSSSSSSSSS